MDASKRNRLEEADWTVGDAQEFLGLSDEGTAFVEVELALHTSVPRVARLNDLEESRADTMTQRGERV